MTLNINSNSYIIFDLDDTLFKEVDYLKSAYLEIASSVDNKRSESIFMEMLEDYNNGEDVFSELISKFDLCLSKSDLIRTYRSHFPTIKLLPYLTELIRYLQRQNIKLGVITDGRKVTQENKLKALGIYDLLSDIIISEEVGTSKPSIQNFTLISNKYPEKHFYYIGDNISKDFVTPNRLGWVTGCLLDDGQNIHSQDLNRVSYDFLPSFVFKAWSEINIVVNE